MFFTGNNQSAVKTTPPAVVLPFYGYAALSFLLAAALLFLSAPAFINQYFHPHLLAIAHLMALGWGTMIILGASHQLVPVIVEGRLYSLTLAHASFFLAAAGIPLLVYGFYVFNMGWPAKWGGRLVLLALLAYLVNLGISMSKGKSENVHALFVFTATLWLFLTALLGLVLVYNFTYPLMPHDSVHYLALHMHAGVIGWFLLLVMGVGSRLIPMFLISKYKNDQLLKVIYYLVNSALLGFIVIYLYTRASELFFLPLLPLLLAITLFIYYCYRAYENRLRRQVDGQLKISLLSVGMLVIPLIFLFIIITSLLVSDREQTALVLAYGFLIFFGWITAIILGMTFKTLPFMVWNRVYHQRAILAQAPNPKDLFHHNVFKMMSAAYLAGVLFFTCGILLKEISLLRGGAILLLVTAGLYNGNVFKMLMHKPEHE